MGIENVTVWMDLEGIMVSETGEKEKDKYLIHMWNLKPQNKRTKKTKLIQRIQMDGYQRGRENEGGQKGDDQQLDFGGDHFAECTDMIL